MKTRNNGRLKNSDLGNKNSEKKIKKNKKKNKKIKNLIKLKNKI